MSSFNTVTKIKYTDNASDLIALTEYIVFQDDKAKRKYIVFKFTNNVTQQLLGMQFEVCQYNAENNLIEKSVVVYDKFLAGAEEEFVPKAKLRVSYNCTSISVRLIEASFDRFNWKEGEYEDNCYKFGQFYNDEKRSEEEKPLKKQKKQKEKKLKNKKLKKSKKPFVIRDATTKNFTRLPVIFNVIAVFAVLAFVLATLFIFKKDAKKFTEGDYLLYKVSGEDVAVYGYQGKETRLVIPEKIGDYNVVKIAGGAFKKSSVSYVTFNCDVLIEADAFTNCTNLKTVTSQCDIMVMSKGFNGCVNLTSVYMPNAVLQRGSLSGSINLASNNATYKNKTEIDLKLVVE